MKSLTAIISAPFLTRVTIRGSRFLGHYKRYQCPVSCICSSTLMTNSLQKAFFDIRNIQLSRAPSITGNNFKGVISKASDTRDL